MRVAERRDAARAAGDDRRAAASIRARFALLAFGGAGPLHACAIADELGMRRVLVPRASGVLSALGLAAAERARRARTVAARVRRRRDRRRPRSPTLPGRSSCALRPALPRPGPRADGPRLRARAGGAARGVRGAARGALRLSRPRRGGRARHRARDAARAGPRRSPCAATTAPSRQASAGGLRGQRTAARSCVASSGRAPRSTGRRSSSCPRRRSRAARLARRLGRRRHARAGARVDAIELQVVTGALRAACEEMGAVLVRSAHSANIKERRDCSTALFDAHGEMVMQAEHIPVHLGAMPAAVAAVLERAPRPGVSWVLNDPYRGGTHLPDITVDHAGRSPAGELLGFAASRAHHADVGGRVPGSMPADSTTLEEEGVVIAPRVLDDAAIDELAAPDAPARPAARRPARPARGQPRRRPAPGASWRARIGRGGLRGGDGRGARLRRAAHARLPGRRSTTATREAQRRPRGPRAATSSCGCAPTVEGERLMLDFTGSADAARRQPQLPAGRHARRPATSPCASSPIPTSRRPPAPTARSRSLAPEGSLLNARAARGRGGRQRRDLLARRRPRARRVRPRARPGDDEQPDARQRATSPTTRRSAAGRARARTPTARAPSTWRCRTRSTRRSRRSSWSSRCASSSTRCAAAAAATARFRGGDGVVREVEALEPMAYSLITERRRHAPPGADGRRPGRARAATLRRRRGAGAEGIGHARGRASACASRRRAAAGTARHRVRPMRVGWIGLGIMGSRMAANLRQGRPRARPSRTAPRATAEAWAAEHGATVADTPAEVARARS